jgi:beta-galactosidase
MKYLGCAYYPEYWGEARVAVDARLMREAGMNLVRLGEFAWSRLEPEEGRYDVGWLHRAVEILGQHGLEVLLCTPTATPPAWLTAGYPEVLLERPDGMAMGHGSRRHYCPASETYRRHCRRIAEQLSAEMSRHRNVIGWQIDNELGPESGACHCATCQARFQAWLKERHGTVAALNEAWRTGFWSVDFSDWRQVRLDDGRVELYSAQKLASRRFRSDLWIEFCREQAAILRRNHPGAIVTTNGMGPIYSPIDYCRLYETLDVACDDLYFDIATMDADALAMNVFRQIKADTPYWLTETGSGALDHNRPPHPDQFRAWAWSSYAHGGDAHLVFRWRTCLSGQEQELQGVLEHSGEPRHRYAAVKRCFTEIAAVRERLGELPLPSAQVAIVQDHDTLWAYEAARIGRDVDYVGLICQLHRELYRRNVLADVIPADRDLARYRLVVLPSTMIVAAEFAERLASFVAGGGTVLAVGQVGLRDADDNYLPGPGPLEDLLGVRIAGGMYLRDHCHPDHCLGRSSAADDVVCRIAGRLRGKAVAGTAGGWVADVVAADSKVLMRFADDLYRGQPGVTEKATGKGRAFYAAAIRLSAAVLEALVGHALAAARVQRGPEASLHVEVIRRGNAVFAINHTDEPVSLRLGVRGKVLVGACARGVASLPPYGVCVVKA